MTETDARPRLRAWTAIARLTSADWSLLRRHTRLRWSAIGLLFVPAIYALIYLSSVWDPGAHTTGLPVGLVNADQGIAFHGKTVRLGDDVLRRLQAKPQFGYQLYEDEAAARQAVRQGLLHFALLIPADFSEQAVPGTRAGAGRIVIYASEGNNYSGASFAKRFAPELAHQLNETLNVQRWSFVLQTSATAGQDLDDLRSGVNRLATGAAALASGANQVKAGSTELSTGVNKAQEGSGQLRQGAAQLSVAGANLADGLTRLGTGLHTLQDRLPPEQDMNGLKRGAARLAAGERQLVQGLNELHTGATRLEEGVAKFRTEGARIPFGGDAVVEAAGQLEEGVRQLGQGIGQATTSATALAGGAERLEAGVGTLTEGVTQLNGGVRQIVNALPPDAELARFNAGARGVGSGSAGLDEGLKTLSGGATQLVGATNRLAEGAATLHTGLTALAAALPPGIQVPEGSADGLAESVQPVLDVVAPVTTNGAGFAPNFMALALWVGSAMCAFLWSFRRVPAPASGGPALATVVGKLAVPATVALGQALIMGVMLPTLLAVPVPNLGRFVATLALTSLTFLAIQFALVRVLGEAGKVIAMLLLVTQLSAAGGTLPIELSTDYFQAIHPWLPFTWVIRALRVALFGAFDGDWFTPISQLLLALAVSLIASSVIGRWKVVPAEDYGPALDMD